MRAGRDRMALTPELVARVARPVEDSGPEPGIAYFTEAEYDASVRAMLEAEGAVGDVWLFAYGSLLWKPVCRDVERRLGVVRGWHRSFCLRLTRWRGTRERPGLMMALDRGGQCRGMACRLPAEEAVASLGKIWRREMSSRPPTNRPRWLDIHTPGGTVRGIAFTADRKGRAYVRPRSLEETADILAGAVGHWGSGAEYLFETVSHLEALGIRDRNLWRLQAVVAERIRDAAEPDRERSRLAAAARRHHTS